MGPPHEGSIRRSHRTMSERSYHGATSRSRSHDDDDSSSSGSGSGSSYSSSSSNNNHHHQNILAIFKNY